MIIANYCISSCTMYTVITVSLDYIMMIAISISLFLMNDPQIFVSSTLWFFGYNISDHVIPSHH